MQLELTAFNCKQSEGYVRVMNIRLELIAKTVKKLL